MAVVPGDRTEHVFQLAEQDFSKGILFSAGSQSMGGLSIRSRNFLVTPEGHISFNSGHIGVTPLVCDIISDSPFSFWNEYFFEHLNRIYWWARHSGSGVLLACSSQSYDPGQIWRFTTGAEHFTKLKLAYGEKMGCSHIPAVDGTKGALWPVPLPENSLSGAMYEVECRNDVFIDFVPYGSYCFVFDGVNQPSVIFPNLSVSRAESPTLGADIHVRTSSGGMLDGVPLGSFIYAFVPVMGKLGSGRTGYGSDSDDSSFLSAALTPVDTDLSGNWVMPTMGTMAVPGSQLCLQMTQGMDEDATWGGWILLANFRNYFESIPSLSEIRIYRTRKNAAGLYYYVGTVQEGEDTFLDTTPDNALGAELELGKTDPPVARLGATYDDRLFTVGSMDEGQRNIIRYSERFRPLSFPEDWFLYAPNLFRDDEIVRVVVVRDSLYFLLNRGILKLVGDTPADYSLVSVSSSVGCVAPRTVAPWKDGVIFLSAEGPVFFSVTGEGEQIQNLSGSMYDYFATQKRSHKSWSLRAAGVADRDYYYISLHEDMLNADEPSSRNNKTFALCLKNGAWSEAFTLPFEDACQTPDMRPLVSCNLRQSAIASGASWAQPEGGGVYELRHDFPYRWNQGSPTFSGGSALVGAAYDPGVGMADTNVPYWLDSAVPSVIWDGLDFGLPDTVKEINRVEVEYIGYGPKNLSLSMYGDQDDSSTLGPGDYAFTNDDGDVESPLAWGLSNQSQVDTDATRTLGERLLRKQVFYASSLSAGTAPVGKTFHVRLGYAANEAGGGAEPSWIVVRKIMFYYYTEDVH